MVYLLQLINKKLSHLVHGIESGISPFCFSFLLVFLGAKLSSAGTTEASLSGAGGHQRHTQWISTEVYSAENQMLDLIPARSVFDHLSSILMYGFEF